METIGIDLHRKRSRFVRMSQGGKVIEKRTIRSSAEAFREAFGGVDESGTRVALEATGYWYWAVDVLEELGLEAHLAHPYKVRAIAESTIKTDTVDATALAHLLRMNWLPESRITPKAMRLLRERLRYRITLVRIRTALKARIHAILGKCGIATPELSDLFGKTGREWLEQVALVQEYRDNLDGYLRTIDFLADEIGRVEAWLNERMKPSHESRLLMDIPGIGQFGAALILSEIGDIRFFRTKRKLSSFVGVVPGARNSGPTLRDTHLKKDSNRYIRWFLSEAVSKAVKVVPAWARLYERIYAGNDKRRPKARVAVMHKMICAAWRVLRTGQRFNRLHNCPELEKDNGELVLGTGLKEGRVTD
jgi:transposase